MTFKIRRAMAVMASNASVFADRGDPWDKSTRDETPTTPDENPELDRYFCRTVKPNGKGSLYAPARKVPEKVTTDRRKIANALNKMRATFRANKGVNVK
jgi:hypothetical protein